MAKDHPSPEYDCSFEYYANVLRRILPQPNVKAWIAFEGAPIGYIIAIKDTTGLKNQIMIFDIFIKDGFRNGIGRDLINEIKTWAIIEKVKRVTWTSQISLKGWERFMGIKANEYNSYYWENV